MAIILHEHVIPTPAGADRYVRTVSLPQGAQVLAVCNIPGDAPRLVVRGDPQATPTDARFSLVRDDIPLDPAEQTAPFVGWVRGYAGGDGTTPIYYLLGPA